MRPESALDCPPYPARCGTNRGTHVPASISTHVICYWATDDPSEGRGFDPLRANQTGEIYSGLAILISSASSWVWLSIAVALGMMTR